MIQNYTIADVFVKYDPEIFSREEISGYVEKSKAMIPTLRTITFELDGGKVACKYTAADVPFERIRRITGYLTGDLNSWNNAKRAEESERVKHNVKELHESG